MNISNKLYLVGMMILFLLSLIVMINVDTNPIETESEGFYAMGIGVVAGACLVIIILELFNGYKDREDEPVVKKARHLKLKQSTNL